MIISREEKYELKKPEKKSVQKKKVYSNFSKNKTIDLILESLFVKR